MELTDPPKFHPLFYWGLWISALRAVVWNRMRPVRFPALLTRIFISVLRCATFTDARRFSPDSMGWNAGLALIRHTTRHRAG